MLFKSKEAAGRRRSALKHKIYFVCGYVQVLWTTRLVLAMADCSVWPSNATYLQNALNVVKSIANLGPTNAAFALLPLQHAAIHWQALLKHRRSLEDSLASGGLDVLNTVSVMFSKPNSAGNDKRRPCQQAIFSTTSSTQTENVWTSSSGWVSQAIGPVPLVKIAEMIGYDAEVRPTPGSRVEQTHVGKLCV